ncbi:hypothetical protein EMGBS15_09350, partial [Filimonas sp.]
HSARLFGQSGQQRLCRYFHRVKCSDRGTNATGGFNASLYSCTLPATSTVTAYDMTASESGSSSVSLISGLNNLGTLTACGTQFEFINWTSTVGSVATTSTINEPFGSFYGNYTSGSTTIQGEDSSGLSGFHYISLL